jgi:hypothetical protein
MLDYNRENGVLKTCLHHLLSFVETRRLFRSGNSGTAAKPHAHHYAPMRRYIVSCEFHKAKAAAVTACIHRLATAWERPLVNLWLVETSLSAAEIRSALLPALGLRDKLYVCETRGDGAALNTPAPKVARRSARLLEGIFSRQGRESRHLRAAIARN